MDKNKTREILKRAQETYGYSNQVSVAAEECCELAMACNKYIRYPDHETACEKIREKIIEEVGDVGICLEHLYMIFQITPEEVAKAKAAKLERLERWLNASSSMYQTTIDREVVKPE